MGVAGGRHLLWLSLRSARRNGVEGRERGWDLEHNWVGWRFGVCNLKFGIWEPPEGPRCGSGSGAGLGAQQQASCSLAERSPASKAATERVAKFLAELLN